ncbi:RraA family protein [Labrys wisconsinensis]|uniref:Putative 4-hydroxy-4-methyl-2-oxoglutarate aldolase n=1 Tax=Labrys wisconsinensis TaxID=425677 RepID=A0ABU0JGB0_9HYPH|nr:RraA family protein [Labrys wisconsinensis]MDQ0473335.1 4-hydroxy-4-methyl-2-oxoglutarate aldolase [Labrys wisconsinensis]
MIEDAPLITLRRPARRPSTAQIAALTGVPTGFAVDALGGRGALAAAIKPVVAEQAVICGVALTCEAGPADNLALFAALPCLQPGDVLVAATDGFREAAVTGDLLLGMARNRGAVGFVTDGAVRDVAGIRALGLPCFAASVTPNSPARNGPGRVGLPVILAGTLVASGDIVLSDPDGVVVVPFEEIDAVIARLDAVRAAEAALDAAVKAGLGLPDFVAKTLAGRVREVE